MGRFSVKGILQAVYVSLQQSTGSLQQFTEVYSESTPVYISISVPKSMERLR